MEDRLIRRACRELGDRVTGPVTHSTVTGQGEQRICLRVPLAGRDLRLEQHLDAAKRCVGLTLSMQSPLALPRPLSYDPDRRRFDDAAELDRDERLQALLRSLLGRVRPSRFTLQPGYRVCTIQAQTLPQPRWGGLRRRLGLGEFVAAVERVEQLLGERPPAEAPGNIEDIFSTFGDLFGDFFGLGRTGADLKLELALSPEQAELGCKIPLSFQRSVRCPTCSGRGGDHDAVQTRCAACQGKGAIVVQRGFFSVQQSCHACNGLGYIARRPCSTCNGAGLVNKQQEVQLTVPAGLPPGATLRLKGMGNEDRQGKAGDLYVGTGSVG